MLQICIYTNGLQMPLAATRRVRSVLIWYYRYVPAKVQACAYIYAYMYVYIYIYAYIDTHAFTYVYMYKYVCIPLAFVRMYVLNTY